MPFFINSHKGFRTLLKDKDNTAHFSVLKILHKDLLTHWNQYDKHKSEIHTCTWRTNTGTYTAVFCISSLSLITYCLLEKYSEPEIR